jgi:hypothetical protein
MTPALRVAVAVFLLWAAYATGAAAWDESVQAIAIADPGDISGLLIAALGGASVLLLLACAFAVATASSRWLR